MHKKMLSLLLLVGALGLAASSAARAQDSDTDFVYDVGNTNTAPGGKALHEGTSSGDTVESIGVANEAANVGAIADTATTVNIGSSTGLSATPTFNETGTVTDPLILTGVVLSNGTNDFVTLNVGGSDDSMAAFNGTSKNFALQITNVKSDGGVGDGTDNKTLALTSGGTARWVAAL